MALDVHSRCTKSHVQCSRYHADLVQGYREERYRQEMELEGQGYKTKDDAERAALITFRQWLEGSKA